MIARMPMDFYMKDRNLERLTDRHMLGAERLSDKFAALHSHGRRFEPHSSHHVGTLGKSFTRSCLYKVMWCSAWLPCS